MFPFRRIFPSTVNLKNYINTSSVIKCENSKKSNEPLNIPKKKAYVSEFERVLTSEKEKIENSDSAADKKKAKLHLKSETLSKKEDKTQQKNTEKLKVKNFFNSPSAKKVLNTALDDVAKEFGEEKTPIKNDLLNYLQTFKITKEKVQVEYDNLLKSKPETSAKSSFRDLKELNIFDGYHNVDLKDRVKLNIWDELEREELEIMSKTHPRNHFEELINWTNEGRLWKFPINNDQGLEEEAKVSFTQHIFLDQYLEPWCPKKGPLRRFMDLVLIGLAKNPHLSVEDKKEHIQWFQNYFESKRKLLQDVGAMSHVKKIKHSGAEECSSDDHVS